VVTRPRPRSARFLVIVLVSLSLVVITLDYRQGDTGPLAALGRATQAALAPLQGAVSAIVRPVESFLSAITHLPTLQERNERLREQIADLEERVASAPNWQQLYENAAGLLGLRTANPGSTAAVVISNGVSNFEWSITIDRGTADGIEVNQPVIAGTVETPRLVGRVIRVTDHSAKVQLAIDRRHAAAAVLGGSGEIGVVSGRGDEDMEMSFVAPSTKVEGNEPVFTVSYSVSGEHGLYPPGILIGTVSQLVPDENELERSVLVAPAVDFSALQFVLVLPRPDARDGGR
jgi:rod shape-determining protein MreC